MISGSTIQFIILALFAGASFLSWVLREYQKSAAKRRQRELLERAQLEHLRTGPKPVARGGAPMNEPVATQTFQASTSQAPRDQLREIAERRRRQMEDLRRRLAAKTSPQTQRPGGSIGAPPPANYQPPKPQRVSKATPKSPTGFPQAQQPDRAFPQAHPSPPRKPQGPSRKPSSGERKPQQRPQQQSPAGEQGAFVDGESYTTRLVPDMPAAVVPGSTGAGRRTVFLGRGMNAAEWRRMIVAHEIFGPPASLRDPEEGPGPIG
ncbi:MAG: hypothetical protein HRU70_04420 [Phycisphaeraceae bacterium]|nr:MAG: hypothetical protein HRU70_04420 [Phycisphaeraceae bacterium]